jgi:hypothetical protein
MDEITSRWDETGLLYGLSDAGKTILAMKMERLAQHLLSSDYRHDERLETYIFPIVRRVCVSRIESSASTATYIYHGNVDPIVLLNDFSEWFHSSNCQDLMADIGVYSGIDVEAEMCAIYCDLFKDKFRLGLNDFKPLQYITKHKL